VEKPKSVKEAPSNLINAGLYIAEPGIMGFVPEGKAMLEYDVFPKIASEGRLFGFMDSGQWFPTDTPERLSKAKEGWKGLACPDAI
jgi:NDP-sugar pyrophosphorylase family protein